MKHKLFLLDLKQYIKQLPKMILMSLVLLGLLGSVCFGAVKLLYANEPVLKASVAILTEDSENVYLNFILQIMQTNENVKEHISFEFMEADTAKAKLNNGEVIAILEFPPNAVEGILNGTNEPIRVIFGKQSDITAIILSEVTTIIGSLLSSAQAGTYTTSRIYTGFDARTLLAEAFSQVDNINFSYVLDRQDLFISTPVSFGTTNSITIYYISALLMALLLFSHSGYSQILHFENNAFFQYCKAYGITTAKHYFLRFLSYTLYITLCLFLLYLLSIPFSGYLYEQGYGLLPISFSLQALPVLFIISIFLSSFALITTALSPTPSMCLLFSMILSGLFMYLGGSILPTAFLPKPLRISAVFVPTYELHQVLIHILSGRDINILRLMSAENGITQSILYLLLWAGGMYLLGLEVLLIRQRKR